MLNDYYQYTISDHFSSAIINHDFSGLDDKEDRQLQDFLGSTPQNLMAGTWDIVDYEGGFDRCEVSGLGANCVTIRLYFHNESLAAQEKLHAELKGIVNLYTGNLLKDVELLAACESLKRMYDKIDLTGLRDPNTGLPQ
jgi:hypothetical protein